MVLLSQMMRTAAFTGSTDYSMFTRIAGRQGGQWAERTVRQAYQAGRSQQAIRELDNLRERGVLTDSEFARLRADLDA